MKDDWDKNAAKSMIYVTNHQKKKKEKKPKQQQTKKRKPMTPLNMNI